MVTSHELRKEMGINSQRESEKYAIERTVEIIQEHYERVFFESAGKKRKLEARLLRILDKWR
jgi:hypothetical protein